MFYFKKVATLLTLVMLCNMQKIYAPQSCCNQVAPILNKSTMTQQIMVQNAIQYIKDMKIDDILGIEEADLTNLATQFSITSNQNNYTILKNLHNQRKGHSFMQCINEHKIMFFDFLHIIANEILEIGLKEHNVTNQEQLSLNDLKKYSILTFVDTKKDADEQLLQLQQDSHMYSPLYNKEAKLFMKKDNQPVINMFAKCGVMTARAHVFIANKINGSFTHYERFQHQIKIITGEDIYENLLMALAMKNISGTLNTNDREEKIKLNKFAYYINIAKNHYHLLFSPNILKVAAHVYDILYALFDNKLPLVEISEVMALIELVETFLQKDETSEQFQYYNRIQDVINYNMLSNNIIPPCSTKASKDIIDFVKYGVESVLQSMSGVVRYTHKNMRFNNLENIATSLYSLTYQFRADVKNKPISNSEEGMIIFLHGIGADGSQFKGEKIPGWRCFSPNGVYPIHVKNVQLGYQWCNPYLFSDENPFLLAEVEIDKIASLYKKQIILFGFSQGGMAACSIAVNSEKQNIKGAIIVYSGITNTEHLRLCNDVAQNRKLIFLYSLSSVYTQQLNAIYKTTATPEEYNNVQPMFQALNNENRRANRGDHIGTAFRESTRRILRHRQIPFEEVLTMQGGHNELDISSDDKNDYVQRIIDKQYPIKQYTIKQEVINQAFNKLQKTLEDYQ